MNLPPLTIPPNVNFITENISLPDGWVVKSEQKSMIELETNIRTLGQLYRTLSDLKKQLPSPVAAAVENNVFQSFSNSIQAIKRKSTDYGSGIPITPIDEYQVASSSLVASTIFTKYPPMIFESLIELHLQCVCCPSWRDPTQVLTAFHERTLSPCLMYAIFAHSAIHGILCHADQFHQPFLIPLAKDCYRLACEFLEFDNITTSTVEALTLMHLFTTLTSSQHYHYSTAATTPTATANTSTSHQQDQHTAHLFLAKRQLGYLGYTNKWNLHAWLRRVDLATTLDTCYSSSTNNHHENIDESNKYIHLKKPHKKQKEQQTNTNNNNNNNNNQQHHPYQQMNYYNFPSPIPSPSSVVSASFTDEHAFQDRLWIYYEIKGWELIHKKESIKAFQSWLHESISELQENQTTNYQQQHHHQHPYPISITTQYRILRLQALYLTGILNKYQSDMMDAFASDNRWAIDEQCTDYFSVTFNNQNAIQQALHNSMTSAFKLIQVVLSLFKLNHKCLIPELMDILSAACTILYFGHKVASDPNITKNASQALNDLICAFENEYYMVQLPKIENCLTKWKSMINSF